MTDHNYMQNYQDYYSSKLRSEYGQPVGCTEDEIANFESRNSIKLPQSYRQYLMWMGNDVKGVFRGSEWFLKDVEENTKALHDFLSEQDVFFKHESPPVCFFSHQGYMYAWFYISDGIDDPKCYYFFEGTENTQVEEIGSFSKFFGRDLPGFS